MKPMSINRGWLRSVVGITLLFSVAPVFSMDEGLNKAVQEVKKSADAHIQALSDLLARAPQIARPSIVQAIAECERSRDIAVEAVELSQTNEPLERAALYRKYAEKKIVEIQTMAQTGQPELIKTLAADYESSIGEAENEIDVAKAQGKNADAETTALAQSMTRHAQVLTALLNAVPEQADKGITRASEASQRSQPRQVATARRTQTRTLAASRAENMDRLQKRRDKLRQIDEARQARKNARNNRRPAPKGKGS
jgi:Domain of unknown function (DUF5667)